MLASYMGHKDVVETLLEVGAKPDIQDEVTCVYYVCFVSVCMHVSICMYLYQCLYMCACVLVCLSISLCVYMCVCVTVCVHADGDTCVKNE